MSLQPNPFAFEPAYRQLQPSERSFVDAYVSDVEARAFKYQKPMAVVLTSPEYPHPMHEDPRTHDMLARTLVRAAISDRVREIGEDKDVSIYKLLKNTWAIANGNIFDAVHVDEFGAPTFHFDKLTPEQQQAIKSFEWKMGVRGPEYKVTYHDKMQAIALVGKHLGVFDGGEGFRNGEEVTKPLLPADMSAEDAAAAYARLIGD